MLHYRIHCSCFISFPSIHTLLFMFRFYFLQATFNPIHFIYHSPFYSYLSYLVALILHGHSTLLSVSLFKKDHFRNITEKILNSDKKFWQFVKLFLMNKGVFGTDFISIKKDNQFIDNAIELVEMSNFL